MTALPARRKIGRRGVIAGLLVGAAALAVPAPCSQPVQHPDAVSLPDFRAQGALDDNEALRRALATGRAVRLPAGRGSARDGAYLIETPVGTTNLVSGAQIFGDGIGRTVIRRPYRSGAFIFFVNSGSAEPACNLTNIRLSDLSLEDDVVQRGFEEHTHLLHMNGVTGLQIDRVAFSGFRGDGLYLGSGHILGMERHNRAIAVRHCLFDGVNRNNRNAISIINGDGVRIEDCQFLNCTRPGHGGARARPGDRAWQSDPFNIHTGLPMPGAIDCEPDADRFTIIRNVSIERCHFAGGGGAAVALLLRANNLLDTPHSGFRIRDCTIERQGTGFTFSGYAGEGAISYPAGYDALYENNALVECDKPFIINGARDLVMRRNRFRDCALAAELGYTGYNHRCTLADNEFVRLGYDIQGVNGILIRNADDILLARNWFVDCGRADGAAGRALCFVGGVIRRFRLIDNQFESPTGRTTYAIGVQGAVMDPSNTASGNVFTFTTNRDFG